MTDTPMPTGPAQTGPAPTGSTPWFEGADVETIGYIQNRGLDKKEAKEAALAAIKSHREAEKHLGAPAESLQRWPKDAADADGWAALNKRLGVPDDVKGYDFSGVKFADGTAIDENFSTAIGTALKNAGVSKDKASAVMKTIVELGDKETVADQAAARDLLTQEMAALKIDWGTNIERNMVIADNAAAELGMTPQELNDMKKGIGAAKVAKIFHKLGLSMGEDRFVGGGRGNEPAGGMTGQQAEARLVEMQNDNDFNKRYMAGDAAARREMDNVSRIVADFRRANRGY